MFFLDENFDNVDKENDEDDDDADNDEDNDEDDEDDVVEKFNLRGIISSFLRNSV